MRVGTRSVLFGVHAFWLHPWFVAWAWWKLYGFPRDPRLWVAFFVHDLGYLGKPDMDGDEGESHPELGARIMLRWFDSPLPGRTARLADRLWGSGGNWHWHDLVLYHSRFYARNEGASPSMLCYADKLAIVLTPWWIYLPLARLSGELSEYMREDLHDGGKYDGEGHVLDGGSRAWLESVQDYLRGGLRRELPDEVAGRVP